MVIAFVREPAPLVTRVRRRTVENGDSTTLVVRRCFQCSAGKSKNVSSFVVSHRFSDSYAANFSRYSSGVRYPSA